MKYLVLLLLLIGCEKQCPKFEYRDYQYLDKVTKVYSGFYKGHTGNIIDRGGFYLNSCRSPHFKVRLDETIDAEQKEVWISQFKLFVERR